MTNLLKAIGFIGLAILAGAGSVYASDAELHKLTCKSKEAGINSRVALYNYYDVASKNKLHRDLTTTLDRAKANVTKAINSYNSRCGEAKATFSEDGTSNVQFKKNY